MDRVSRTQSRFVPHMLGIVVIVALFVTACGASRSDERQVRPTSAPAYDEVLPTMPARHDEPSSQVFVNGLQVSDDELQTLVEQYNLHISDGYYWYDPYSGGWGYEGGPMVGFIIPGLAIGGRLRTDASGGGTGFYVNGRELHPQDVSFLMQILGQFPQGEYWLDGRSNFGEVHGSRQVNLIAIMQQQRTQAPISPESPYQGASNGGDSLNFVQGPCSVIEGIYSCNSSP